MKNPLSKVAHNWLRPFYFTVQPRPQPTAHSPQPTAHSPQPRIDFSYYEILGPDICSLICDWDVRIGAHHFLKDPIPLKGFRLCPPNKIVSTKITDIPSPLSLPLSNTEIPRPGYLLKTMGHHHNSGIPITK